MLNFLKQMFRPVSVNKSATPSQSFPVFATASGVNVTPETLLKLGAVWRAVTLISSSVGKMPCHLYRGDESTRERAREDSRFNLLKLEPSPGISAMDFFQTLTAHVIHRGNAYAYIYRDKKTFRPLELWIVPPHCVKPVRRDGVISYLVKIDDAEPMAIPYFDMIHIRGLGYDGLVGYSVVEYMATDGGLAQAMRDYSSEFFSNGAIVDLVVTPTVPLTDDQYNLLRTSWGQGFSGKGKRHKAAVAPAPLNVQPVTINARDSQLIESRAQSIRDIANWYGVPPHKLGDTSKSGYNSLESENMSFLSDCLDTWLVKFEQEFTIKLLTEEEKRSGSFFFEFNRGAFLRSDMNSRYTALNKAVGAPFMTPNEARRIENLNPVAGGDQLLKPLNMGNQGDWNDAQKTDA